ncbi:helix-turn-helix domain-containing protein [Skermania sp. ID1734]|nr:helix-turn-helix domain-containing protein [Skermania sp. ID1734]
MDTATATAYIGLEGEHTLAAWRAKGIGPAYVRIGTRTIRYSIADLDAWLEAQRTVPGTVAAQSESVATAAKGCAA